jgi:pimeloyl-ACP methyl ester carboxylesterase
MPPRHRARALQLGDLSPLDLPLLAALRGVLLGVLLGGCTFQPGPRCPRPPLPLPAWTTTMPSVEPPRLEELQDHGGGMSTGRLTSNGETVRFRLRRQNQATTPPLVLLVPILAGGEELMDQVAQGMCAQGFDVAFCARVGSALKQPQRGRELDELFRRTVLHQRLLLAWLRGPENPSPPATFALGLSMGGMVTTVLAALDPDLAGVAICLAGGDLSSMVLSSTEGRVQQWVDWRFEADGIGHDSLQWELEQCLRHEPLAFAACIPTRKVLFVSAQFDTVVPERNQDLLWEALGRPARMKVPFGHYSSALAISSVLAAAAAHFTALVPKKPEDEGPQLTNAYGSVRRK